jgi:hypothetical protein
MLLLDFLIDLLVLLLLLLLLEVLISIRSIDGNFGSVLKLVLTNLVEDLLFMYFVDNNAGLKK